MMVPLAIIVPHRPGPGAVVAQISLTYHSQPLPHTPIRPPVAHLQPPHPTCHPSPPSPPSSTPIPPVHVSHPSQHHSHAPAPKGKKQPECKLQSVG